MSSLGERQARPTKEKKGRKKKMKTKTTKKEVKAINAKIEAIKKEITGNRYKSAAIRQKSYREEVVTVANSKQKGAKALVDAGATEAVVWGASNHWAGKFANALREAGYKVEFGAGIGGGRRRKATASEIWIAIK